MVRYDGWPEELKDLQVSLCARIQALSDTQEIHIHFPWIWRFRKPCTGNILPYDYSRSTTSPFKSENVIQGGNGKYHKHKLDTLVEPYPSTRVNIGYLKAYAYTTGPDE